MRALTLITCLVASLMISACDSAPWQAGLDQFIGSEQSGLMNIHHSGLEYAGSQGLKAGSGL